jgi:hypothetical protein
MNIRELYKEKALEINAALQAFKDMKKDGRNLKLFRNLQFELYQLNKLMVA